jgi:hypothetical protein
VKLAKIWHSRAARGSSPALELLLDRCLDPEPFPAAPADPDAAVPELLRIAAGVLAGRLDDA